VRDRERERKCVREREEERFREILGGKKRERENNRERE